MNAQQKKAEILDALLEHRGIEHILSAASRVLRNPVLMVNRVGTYEGMSRTDEFGDEYWERFIAAMPYDMVLEEVEQKDLSARLMATDDVITERFAFFDRDVRGTRVRDRVDVLGYVSIVLERQLQGDDDRVLVALARMLAVELVYQSQHVSWRDDDTVLVQSLLSGEVHEEDLAVVARKSGLSGEESMRMIVVRYGPSQEVSALLAKNSLAASLSCRLCGVYGSDVILVVDERAHTARALGIVKRCTEGSKGVGVSLPFGSLASFALAYGQATDSVRISQLLGRKGPVYFYDEVMPYRLIEAALSGTSPEGFIDPIVRTVIEHDERNGTDLAATLRTYVDVGRNLNACAKAMFTHRNTIHYRMRRIYDLCGIDAIDDERAFSIALSYRILRVLNAADSV